MSKQDLIERKQYMQQLRNLKGLNMQEMYIFEKE